MTDPELESRLRAWYRNEVDEGEPAPAELRHALQTVRTARPVALRGRLARGRSMAVLAVAAVLLVGGTLAAGAGLVRLPTVVPPVAPDASNEPVPTAAATGAPAPTAAVRVGDLIAYTRVVQRPTGCRAPEGCTAARLWLIGVDGRGSREVFPDGISQQVFLAWSPDGTRLLYSDGGRLFVTDVQGSEPTLVETGCAAPTPTTPLACQQDTQVAFSSDGRHLVFVRESNDADGYLGPTSISTMDLATGEVRELQATTPGGGSSPDWSPDGDHILFSRPGLRSEGSSLAPIEPGVFVIGVDGQGLRQVTPATLPALDAAWSPDGRRIVFVSPRSDRPERVGDLYTIRPDGSDPRPLTTDGTAASPRVMPDGRILYTRFPDAAGSEDEGGWWIIDADGRGAALLVPASAIGLLVDEPPIIATGVIQPLGGAAIVPPPWTPRPPVAVGPPAPTPEATPRPTLGPGFTWTGVPVFEHDGRTGMTATLMLDGRVLVTEGCETTAALYDPATGTFQPTGSLSSPRFFATATRLADGHVLIAGGYDCGRGGQDGVWATAEVYDPARGTFTPTGSMGVPREFHTATLLPDGRVLIAGGFTAPAPTGIGTMTLASVRTAESSTSTLARAELFDPATGTFSPTDTMRAARMHHTATALADGRVLLVGGGGESQASSASAEIYDPTLGTFRTTGSLATGRWLHSATRLLDGRVLVVGGRSPADAVHRSAELYDPSSGRFGSAGQLGEGRQEHTATLLPDGHVLVVGGFWSDGSSWRVLASAELFDPAALAFGDAGSIGAPRSGHSATALADGRVLIAGGSDIGLDGAVGVPSALVYAP